jgi:uncharacterized membrane protein YvlD (DUF360 family)
MTYLKSLFFNFLAVFFASHILAGIEVSNPTKLPHVGADVLFALSLGLLNSLIVPVLKAVDRVPHVTKIALFSLAFAFGSYAVLKFFPIGIEVATINGYLIASFLVACASFLTNYLEMRSSLPKAPKPPEEPPPVE